MARIGPIERREMRLAFSMLGPTIAAVVLVVVFPLLANFWISVKPVELSDLRAAKPLVRERVKGKVEVAGDSFQVTYRVRSSVPKKAVYNSGFSDQIPDGLAVDFADTRCSFNQSSRLFDCQTGTLEGGQREQIELTLTADASFFEQQFASPKTTRVRITGAGENSLTNLNFTLANFIKVFNADQFWEVLWVSIVYTIGGTGGALILGLFAAQLMMTAFPGRSFVRGLFLFPYVSPVIAVAFTWVFLLDPFSGTVNSILTSTGATTEAINFLGERGIALWTVIAFEAWRYFPLAFLFILARMQSLSSDLNEAADMDGASPLQKFAYISLPQLLGIISTLFVLRFIWTFNKFDDIFLLTGGASGTLTLTVNVYEQAFALSNLGAGAAVAVVIFFFLLLFVGIYFRFAPKEEGM